MKIEFKDGSYIEFSTSSKNIMVTILAKDEFNNLKNIINSVEITEGQLDDLVKSVKKS